jgi:hypothetical protein
MPSWSQTDTLPFRRFEPSVQLRTFEANFYKTTPQWTERTPYPDFVPDEPIQMEAPQQLVVLPPPGVWKASVERHQEWREKHRKWLLNPANRPSRWFMGFGQVPVAGKPVKEFLYR